MSNHHKRTVPSTNIIRKFDVDRGILPIYLFRKPIPEVQNAISHEIAALSGLERLVLRLGRYGQWLCGDLVQNTPLRPRVYPNIARLPLVLASMT